MSSSNVTSASLSEVDQEEDSSKRKKEGGGGASSKEHHVSDGRDKKLVTPPPIIGPDGKQLTRPTDAQGRPLPIYVDSERKPILDENGKPIALKFGKDGKPIPIDKLMGDDQIEVKRAAVLNNGPKEKIIPNFVLWVGIAECIVSLSMGIYYAYLATTQNGTTLQMKLAGTSALFFIAALAAGLPGFAVKKNKAIFLWIWTGLCTVLLLIQIAINATLENFIKNSIFMGTLYSFIRLLVIIGVACMIVITDDPRYTYTGTGASQRYVTSGSYPRAVAGGAGRGGAAPQTVIVQRPVAVPSYGYGSSYADAALLGLAAGSMFHHHHYYDPWDYGYGGGWGGGYGGFDDYGYGGWGGDDFYF